MAERVTKKELEEMVAIINKSLGREFYLDYATYYGGYYLSERGENYTVHTTDNSRMPAKEFKAYLKGIIWGIEHK